MKKVIGKSVTMGVEGYTVKCNNTIDKRIVVMMDNYINKLESVSEDDYKTDITQYCCGGTRAAIATKVFRSVLENDIDLSALAIYNYDILSISLKSLVYLDREHIGVRYTDLLNKLMSATTRSESIQIASDYLQWLKGSVDISNIDNDTKKEFVDFFNVVKQSQLSASLRMIIEESDNMIEFIKTGKFLSHCDSASEEEYIYIIAHNAMSYLMLHENIAYSGRKDEDICFLCISSIMKNYQSLVDYKFVKPIFKFYQKNKYHGIYHDEVISYLRENNGKLRDLVRSVLVISRYGEESIKYINDSPTSLMLSYNMESIKDNYVKKLNDSVHSKIRCISELSSNGDIKNNLSLIISEFKTLSELATKANIANSVDCQDTPVGPFTTIEKLLPNVEQLEDWQSDFTHIADYCASQIIKLKESNNDNDNATSIITEFISYIKEKISNNTDTEMITNVTIRMVDEKIKYLKTTSHNILNTLDNLSNTIVDLNYVGSYTPLIFEILNDTFSLAVVHYDMCYTDVSSKFMCIKYLEDKINGTVNSNGVLTYDFFFAVLNSELFAKGSEFYKTRLNASQATVLINEIKHINEILSKEISRYGWFLKRYTENDKLGEDNNE